MCVKHQIFSLQEHLIENYEMKKVNIPLDLWLELQDNGLRSIRTYNGGADSSRRRLRIQVSESTLVM